jgi:hypothetical protein
VRSARGPVGDFGYATGKPPREAGYKRALAAEMAQLGDFLEPAD